MSEPGFGIYLHWPYCSAICPYCDFNVYRQRGANSEALLTAIERDIEGHGARFGRRRAQSVFFGGGTPSLLSGAEIARLIDAASRAFQLDAACEITLEANPEDAARYAEHAAAGVNRFSIGAQAFDDAALKALGRQHDAAASLRAVEVAASTGARVSLDLMYAREGQDVAAWREELRGALALPVEHVSLYQLTIEPGTAFARKAERGALVPPDNDTGASLYEATQEECDRAGFPAYEISNHARTAKAQARHNLIYWRSGDWAGIGPGAHGRMTEHGVRLELAAQRRPGDYIAAVNANSLGLAQETPLSPQQSADEMLLMGLRLEEGVDLARLDALRATPVDRSAVVWLASQDLLVHDGARIRLTPRGRALANRVIAELA